MKVKISVFLFTIFYTKVIFACQYNSEDVIGSYVHQSGETYYEAFSLEKNRKFSSWLHDRPATTGEWQMNRCVITMLEDGFENPTVLDLQKINSKIIAVRFKEFKNQTIFKKNK